MLLSVLGLSGILMFTGCTSTSTGTLNAAAAILQAGAMKGAEYAIQKNTNNAKWFELADTTIDTFLLGTDLTPEAFNASLESVAPQVQNQWIQLGIDVVEVGYQASYGQYVIGQVNSNAYAKILLTAVGNGFDQAISNTTSIVTLKLPVKVARPSLFVAVPPGKFDFSLVAPKLKK